MIITVASGKGGTGKTTVAVNLALVLDRALLIDCDVEEPDANLFLGLELHQHSEVTLAVPVIDETKCTMCRRCVEFCMFNALAAAGEGILLFPELCHGCGGCEIVCPEKAITEKQRRIGVIEAGTSGVLEFMRGVLDTGEPMATPVIGALKKAAPPVNRDQWMILDSPPGTACSFIETVDGCDLCVMVAEPTPFGLHDLQAAVEAASTLDVPICVVINRDGSGDNGVERFCSERAIPIVGRLPVDMELARLYSSGTPVVRASRDWRERFLELAAAIREMVLARDGVSGEVDR